MNRSIRVTQPAIGRLSLIVLVAVSAIVGCGGGSFEAPPVEALQSIENVGKWYQLYRASHGGKQPADDAAFLEFVNSTLTGRGQAAVDLDTLLKSPHDGERYVVRYGEVRSGDLERNIVAHEKNGVNGMKLMVTELARSRVVDEAELQSLLSQQQISNK